MAGGGRSRTYTAAFIVIAIALSALCLQRQQQHVKDARLQFMFEHNAFATLLPNYCFDPG
jgi:hypothetical protein